MIRNKFSLSHHKLFTCNMGELVPIGLLEVLPGDSFQMASSALVRCSPLLTPVMHPVDVRIHHWFVPHRLVWTDWENFITGGPDGNNASVPPTISTGAGVAVSSLADYLGIPTSVASKAYSALPTRGYQLIWREWYRDQDLQTAPTIDLTDGADTTTTTTLQNCDWEKDYLTSARPWEQKGPSITLPLGTSAPVATDAAAGSNISVRSTTQSNLQKALTSDTGNVKLDTATIAPAGDRLYADLSLASAASVNALREAFALQRYEEARARYGSRYTEYLRYLGVRSSDARLQRPEYLGGGRNTIQFSEVLQTGGTSAGAQTGVGNLGGHGIAATRSNRFRRFFEEHGYIHSFMSIRPKTMYIQGLRRTFLRTSKEDYWQKELEHIGQQAVQNQEVWLGATSATGTFGFSDRYAEYRTEESWVSGEFRSTLNMWHFARSFASEPALNADFVKCVPSEVPFAVNSANTMWIMVKNSVQARRALSKQANSFIY